MVPQISTLCEVGTGVVSFLTTFFASGVAPATAVAATFAATSGVTRCPVSRRSASGTRHGIGATPPSTTRAERQTSLSMSSATAADTTA